MRPGIARRWVKALRSEEYEQTRGRLRRGEKSMCCLGVLCDLAPKSVGEWDKHTYVARDGTAPTSGLSPAELPPAAIGVWAELSSASAHELATLNDDARASFGEIADHIEQNWKRL